MKIDGKALSRWLIAVLLAFGGSVLCLMASLTLAFMIDQWSVTGRFDLPVEELFDRPLDASGNLVSIAGIATAFLLICATLPQALLKRESLPGYLVICALLPLGLMFVRGMFGEPVLLAWGAMATGAFWWFSFRRSKVLPGGSVRTLRYAWLFLALMAMGDGLVIAHEYLDYRHKAALDRDSQKEEDRGIAGGIAVGSDLLLYDFDGKLVLWNTRNWSGRELAGKGIVDVVAANGEAAWVLSAPALVVDRDGNVVETDGQFVLSQFHAGQLHALPPVHYNAHERPSVLAVRNGEPIAIGPKAIYSYDTKSATWDKSVLHEAGTIYPLDGFPVAAVSRDGKMLAIGLNKGEWGGGLRTVNLNDGTVSRPESRSSGALCAGPLNSECDPVTGVVPDPQDKHCVLASIGLSHMLKDGRIIRVCPNGVTVVFERALEAPSATVQRYLLGVTQGKVAQPLQTEPFFALLQSGDGSIWGVTPFAAYRREKGGWSRHAMPELTEHGHLRIAEGLPGMLILSTWRNATHSMSGITPMAIPVL